MEKKLTHHLLLMGIIAAIISIMATAFTFQRRAEYQINTGMATTAQIICAIYNTTENYNAMANYLPNGYYMQVIDYSGNLLYDSRYTVYSLDTEEKYYAYQDMIDSYNPQEMIHRPEVQNALQFGHGSARLHNPAYSTDEYRYVMRMIRKQFVILYNTDFSIWVWYSGTIPFMLLTLGSIVLLSFVLSVLVTKRLVAPVNRLSSHLDDEDLQFDQKTIYPELVPFVSEIYIQRQRNRQRISELAEEKNKLTAIMKEMSEGIVMIDRQRRIIMANDMAQQYFNLYNTDEENRPLYLSNNATLKSCVDSALNGQSQTVVTEIGGRQLQIMADPIFSDLEQTAIVCSVRDITEQMAVDKVKQEFTANVSHELKTPLASISGYAEMIEEGIAQPQDIKKFAHIIHKESTRLRSLINDIIKLSQLDEDSRIAHDPVDLMEIVDESVDVMMLTARQKNIQLFMDGTGGQVTGDRDLLQELVHNLLGNAIKYNRPGGEVHIFVHNHILKITDTGIGIPDSAKPHLFDRFYRVEKSRSKDLGGTGLGLAIVKHITDLHHAKIFIEDNPGGGTCFTVKFPDTF